MSKNIKTTLAMAITAVMLGIAPSAAASVDTSNPAFAPVGERTSIPFGHAEFCSANRSECGLNTHVVDAVTLSQPLWQLLLTINAEANASIVPETDEQLYRVAEYWTYPQGSGDCEDIALAKRRALIEAGWPASALLLTVVRQANGEGHAVLMVRTDRGDLVLDNQEGDIRVWKDTGYRFVKRQSQTDQSQWVDILDGRALVVATR